MKLALILLSLLSLNLALGEEYLGEAPQADVFQPEQSGEDNLDSEFQGLSPEELAELEAMETQALSDEVNEGQAAIFVE